MKHELKLCPLEPGLETTLAELFHVFQEMKDSAFFNPHPFTHEHAQEIARYDGRDFYALILAQDCAVGYGLLRGWDEGYDIPSLGLAIHPDYRGAGLGRLLMDYLHSVAVLRGSQKVRLRVNKENTCAQSLYVNLGYEFQDHSNDFLVGFLTLNQVGPGVAA